MPLYFGGLVTTLKLLALSLFFGLLCALPLGLMRVSKNAVVNMTAWLYTYVIRGTPMLVQLFLIYYGLAHRDLSRFFPARLGNRTDSTPRNWKRNPARKNTAMIRKNKMAARGTGEPSWGMRRSGVGGEGGGRGAL